MHDLLANDDTSFQEKMQGFIIMSILELTLNRPDLQYKHIQAMLRYIDEEGRTCFLVNSYLQPRLMCNTPWLLGFMVYDETFLSSKDALFEATNRFTQAILDIKIWVGYVELLRNALLSEDTWSHQEFDRLCKESKSFPRIRSYIDHMLTDLLGRQQTRYFWVTPIFFFFFAISIPQAVYDYDLTTSLYFLRLIEKKIIESLSFGQSQTSEVAPGVCWLSSQSKPPMLSTLRDATHPITHENEVRILQRITDILKVIPLLSWSSTRELARCLGTCALVVVEPENAVSSFNEKWIKARQAEIEYNWYLGRVKNTPMDA